VKPRRIHLRNVRRMRDAIACILRVRLSEALDLAPALANGEPAALHAFRIACKRLRYAAERFAARDRELTPAAERLAQVQDALGEVHDRDVLLAILPPTIPETERRLKAERSEFAEQASRLWEGVTPLLSRYTM
jgi:CHAD domain-containing protein